MTLNFGVLRSAVHASPSRRSWAYLCALVESLSAQMLDEVALPYALHHLERWPDELRVLPKRWLWEHVLEGESPAFLSLARRLELPEPDVTGLPMAVFYELLCEARGLDSIKQLQWRAHRVDEAKAEHLFLSPLGRGLEVLDVRMGSLGDQWTHLLAEAPGLAGLRRLELEDEVLSDRGLAFLGGAPSALPELEALSVKTWTLSGRRRGRAGAEQILCLPRLKRLTLTCRKAPVTELTQALVRHPGFAGLEYLSIGSGVEEETLEALAEAGAMNLKELALLEVTKRAGAIHLLVEHASFRRLKGLHLVASEQEASWGAEQWSGDQIVRCLVEGELEVERLSLDLMGITDVGIELLVRAPHLRGLKALSLSSNAFTSRGARMLVEAPWFEQLEFFRAYAPNLDSESLRLLGLPGSWF